MILEKQTDNIILEEGVVEESTKMEIDKDSHIFLMRLLSKFYSDAIGSLIRETASNALDSHRECGVKEPIIVSLKPDQRGQYYFSVEDFGCGLDESDVENIISKYGKSTKRNSSVQLGAFGLGFKSPLAYTSSFYFIGRKGGIERKWMLYEAENDENKIDLLYSQPTAEKNGVKIIVPIKLHDHRTFIERIKEQLAYFEDVYFDVPDIDNNFKIIRSTDWQWSQLNKNNKLHICLDNVYYPLDFSLLGIDVINFPVAIRLSLTDGVFPVPNREQLKYSPEAKSKILEKIVKVADYFTTKYNESIEETSDIFKVFEYYDKSSKYVAGQTPDPLEISDIIDHSTIAIKKPILKDVKLLDLERIHKVRDMLFHEFTANYSYNFYNGRFKNIESSRYYKTLRYRDVEGGNVIYVYSDKLTPNKKQYIKDTYFKTRPNNQSYIYFVKKDKPITLKPSNGSTGEYDNFYNLLELNNYPKSQWRQLVHEARHIIKLLTKNFVFLGDVTIPKAWLDSRKLKKVTTKATVTKKTKVEGEIIGRAAARLERWVDGRECKFVNKTFNLADLHQDSTFYVYGGEEQDELFNKLYTVVSHSTVPVIFADRNLKALENVKIHNLIKWNEFMKGEHIIFRRVVTAYLIEELYSNNKKTFDRLDIVEEISPELKNKLEQLNLYRKTHHRHGQKAMYEIMLDVAQKENLFDTSIYHVYKEIKEKLEKLYFLSPLLRDISTYDNEKQINALKDLFRYHKERMNWKNYVKEEELVENQNNTI